MAEFLLENRERVDPTDAATVRKVDYSAGKKQIVGVRQFCFLMGKIPFSNRYFNFLFTNVEAKELRTSKSLEILKRNLSAGSNFTLATLPKRIWSLFNAPCRYYEVRWKDLTAKEPGVGGEKWIPLLRSIPYWNEWERGSRVAKEAQSYFTPSRQIGFGLPPSDSCECHSVSSFRTALFGYFTITIIRRFGEVTPIRLKEAQWSLWGFASYYPEF